MENIQIDPEFKALIPPLAPQERDQLEENLKADGCRDPIVTWQGWLLDGHNRFEICTRLGIEYRVTSLDLADKAAALDWMDANQLGRRNLTPEQMSLLRGRIYNRSKKPAGGREGRDFSDGQNVQPKAATHETLGDRFGVSGKTVQRDGKFVSDIESLEQYSPGIGQRVMAGEVKRKDVAEAAEIVSSIPESERTPEAVKEAIAHNHRAQGTGDNEWYTPQEYIESARRVMGAIDLDPASSEVAQERVKAGAFFTIEDDGLLQPWQGRVWLNPPYAQPAIQHFMEKVTGEHLKGAIRQAIVLTHNYTDTRWFHIGVSGASAICFTRGRIGFLNPEGKKAAPTQGQAFFYYGESTAAFREEFSKYGFVVEVMARQIAKELAA